MKPIHQYIYIIAIGCMSFITQACYEDKGNYEYDESIKDIQVSMQSSYVVKLQKNKFIHQINPQINVPDGDTTRLQYVWIRVNEAIGIMDTIATTKTLNLEIDPTAKDFSYEYKLRLYVTDPKTNGVTMIPTTLQLAKPYAYSWLVLHEINGHAELGSIDYASGHISVNPNAYSEEQGISFTEKPSALGVTKKYISTNTLWGYPSKMVSQIYVMTGNSAESGLIDQTQYLTLLMPWNNLIAAAQQSDIDYTDIQTATADAGMVVASKGNVFRNCNTSPLLFKMNPSAQLVGEYYIDKIISGPNCGLAYDKKGHRFVKLDYTGRWYSTTQSSIVNAGNITPIRNPEGSIANPNMIDPNENIIKLINGYRYSLENPAAWLKYSAYAYALCPNQKSKVYVFRYYPISSAASASGTPLQAIYTFDTPKDIDQDTPMCSSFEYNNIIFYAVNNSIYKLDFTSGKSTIVYTHPDTDAKITKLKMAVESYTESAANFNGNATYGHPYSMTMGVALQTADGKGKIVVLQLNNAGKIEENKKYPSIQIHEGFGKIKDFDFI